MKHPGLWIGLAAAGYLAWRNSGVSAGDPRLDAINNALGDQLNADTVVGDATALYKTDWALRMNVTPSQLFHQLLLPASRIAFDDLREIDLAYAALMLGADPSVPPIPKGGAAGCPIGVGESALKEVNAKFQSEADAAGGVGSLLNVVASIFGVDTKSFDANYGLGRAAKEVESAKFDLSKLAGSRVYLPTALSWKTPLKRTVKFGRDAARSAQWLIPDGTIAIDPYTNAKAAMDLGTDRKTGEVIGDLSPWNGSATPNLAGHGVAIRGGLLMLELMKNKTSAGTIDHSSDFGDIGEWEIPWNSQLLSCTAALQVRLLARARFMRTLDFIAAMAFPPSDVSPLSAFSADSSFNGPQYCWQYTYRGRRIESIFPPHPKDGATQVVEPIGGGATIYNGGVPKTAPKLVATATQSASLAATFARLKG